MKKIAICALCLLLTAALFSGCRRNVGTETTAPTQTTTQPTTKPTTPTTAPTTPSTTPTTAPTGDTMVPGSTGSNQTEGTGGKVGSNGTVRP